MLYVKEVFPLSIKSHNKIVKNILNSNDIHFEEQTTYSIVIFDNQQPIATGSLINNIIVNTSIITEYKGGTVFNLLISSLINKIFESNAKKAFVYTNVHAAKSFEHINFKLITTIDGISLLEYGNSLINDYLAKLPKKQVSNSAAIIMNANPFTKGHLYLIDKALENSDWLYLFIVSQDSSEFSFKDRKQMVYEGTKHLSNVSLIDTGDYIISNVTFPTYFLKDKSDLSKVKIQSKFDSDIFLKYIAPYLEIKKRFVGEEPFSTTTNIYNTQMKKEFSKSNVDLIEVPRLAKDNEIISASLVRKYIKNKNINKIKSFVPDTTYLYILNKKGDRTDEKQ